MKDTRPPNVDTNSSFFAVGSQVRLRRRVFSSSCSTSLNSFPVAIVFSGQQLGNPALRLGYPRYLASSWDLAGSLERNGGDRVG
jgi:hypothetical protein